MLRFVPRMMVFLVSVSALLRWSRWSHEQLSDRPRCDMLGKANCLGHGSRLSKLKGKWQMTKQRCSTPIGLYRSNFYLKLSLVAVGFILLTQGDARAQSFLASVSGIVNDPTASVAPNVKVTATDIARGVSFTATSNQDGVYLINNLIPSTYKGTAEAAGFQTYALNGFPLQVKQ